MWSATLVQNFDVASLQVCHKMDEWGCRYSICNFKNFQPFKHHDTRGFCGIAFKRINTYCLIPAIFPHQMVRLAEFLLLFNHCYFSTYITRSKQNQSSIWTIQQSNPIQLPCRYITAYGTLSLKDALSLRVAPRQGHSQRFWTLWNDISVSLTTLIFLVGHGSL